MYTNKLKLSFENSLLKLLFILTKFRVISRIKTNKKVWLTDDLE